MCEHVESDLNDECQCVNMLCQASIITVNGVFAKILHQYEITLGSIPIWFHKCEWSFVSPSVTGGFWGLLSLLHIGCHESLIVIIR